MKGNLECQLPNPKFRTGFANTKFNKYCGECLLKLVAGNQRGRWCDKHVYMEITCRGEKR
jgi:hypothetical protein